MKKKLAIISSHPIQYNAPMFALLSRSERLEIKVFYTWSQSRESLFDKDFGKKIEWDIPLLEGYDHEFVENISQIPGPGSFKGIVCPQLNDKIAGWRADALLVFGWNYHAHYGAMKRFKGRIPVCFRGDSTLIDETGGAKQIARRLFLTWIYRHTDYAFYVGENNRRYFIRHGLKPHQLVFAPHAIDNRRFSDPEGLHSERAAAWRKELGIGESEIVILFVGKFEPKKNPELLLEAFRSLQQPGIHLLFAGNGILEEPLKRSAAPLPNVRFLPFQNQTMMPVVYALSDLLVLPSQGPGETWGLAVNEAMAGARAVIVSDKTGCAIDLVENGKNGYIFRSGNAAELAGHLRTMTRSKEELRKMGACSRQKIADWSFEAIVKSIEEHISRIIP